MSDHITELTPLQKLRHVATVVLMWPVSRTLIHGSVRTRILLFDGEQVLLVRPTLFSMHWQLPGGGIDDGESLEDCAMREAKEELGLSVHPDSVQHVKQRVIAKHGYRYTVELFIGEADTSSMRIRRSEIVEARLFSVDNLPENITSITKELIGACIETKGIKKRID